MVISTEFLSKKNDLNLERLPIDEAHTDSLEFLTLVESEELGKKVLSLEKSLDYCNENSVRFDDFVSNIAHHYFLTEDDIAFSVEPSLIYLDEEVNETIKSFSKYGIPYCFTNNTNTNESKMLSIICTEAVVNNYPDLIDVFNEGFFDTLKSRTKTMVSGAASGIRQGAVHGGARFMGGIANSVANGLRNGVVKGSEDLVNNKLFGIFDAKDSRGHTQRNLGVKNAVGRFTDNDEIKNMAASIIGGVRDQASSDIVNKLQSKLGLTPGKPINVSNLFNAVLQKIGYYKDRAIEAQNNNNPQQRSTFQKIVDKLVELKNKLLAKLRGHSYGGPPMAGPAPTQ